MNLSLTTWGNPLRNVSQGGGVHVRRWGLIAKFREADIGVSRRTFERSEQTNFPSVFGSGQEPSTSPKTKNER